MIGETQMLDHFERVRRVRDGEWMALCPAHADKNPSLHVTLKDARWLLHCMAGCEFDAVLEAARLDKQDLFTENGNGPRDEEAVYRYLDEHGEPLFEVVRFAGKRFAQRTPDGSWGLNGTRRVLYRLPRVLEAVKRGEDILVAEGEKDVHTLEALGIAATCNPGGAGKWRPEYAEMLRGGKVTILADRDEPGYDHARQVAKSLDGMAAEVDVVEPTKGKDISDHLATGGTVAELVAVPGATVPPGLGEVAPGTALESDFDPAKFRVLDVAQMVAETPPPVPWQVEGLTVQGDMTVMTGDPGAGKSLLALTLCGAVAGGESIAGIECAAGTVVYLDAENGGREIHRRLHSLGIPLAGVTVVEADGVNLRDDSDFKGLESLIKVYAPSMVVLDSLTALWPGANERKTEDVAPTLYAIKQLAERHGVAILVLHHRPKDGGEYRGTTAIAAAAQLGFTLSKVKGDPDRTRRRLHCWKCRPAAEPADRWVHLDADRGMVLVGVAEPYEDPEEPERQAPARAALAPRFLDALGDRRMGLSEIAGRLGVSPKDGTLRRVAEHLEAGGEVVRGEDKRYARCEVPGANGSKGNGTVALGTTLSRAESENGHQPELEEYAEAEIERLREEGPA
jgi:5S rRNA maturation endonuclease (ribonuclease M5)/archaellum biogenesis ATPase FlaH